MVFSIGYEDDLRLAKETLQEIANQEENVLSEPAPFVAVGELTACVKLFVRVWVKNEDFAKVNFDMIEKVKLAFDAKRISIPHPPLTSTPEA